MDDKFEIVNFEKWRIVLIMIYLAWKKEVSVNVSTWEYAMGVLIHDWTHSAGCNELNPT